MRSPLFIARTKIEQTAKLPLLFNLMIYSSWHWCLIYKQWKEIECRQDSLTCSLQLTNVVSSRERHRVATTFGYDLFACENTLVVGCKRLYCVRMKFPSAKFPGRWMNLFCWYFSTYTMKTNIYVASVMAESPLLKVPFAVTRRWTTWNTYRPATEVWRGNTQ